MYVPKFCRVAVAIDDLAAFEADGKSVLGLDFYSPEVDAHFTTFSVAFGEHGLLAISPNTDVPFIQSKLIEVAIDVENATESHDKFVAAGYQPIVVNRLPTPDADEYLFGREFHNIPFMVCNRGDNEAEARVQIPSFRELDAAPFPKVTSVTLAVDDIDAVASDLSALFDMQFVEGDPQGLGTRALTGRHRVTLVQGGSTLASQFEAPLAAVNIGYDDVEAAKDRLEAAGYPVLYQQAMKSGGTAYHFGKAFHGMPLFIHPSSADAEMIGV
ncbi:hypothetical protein [Sphingobium sp. CECT 9361]|uniref:hypothetical protein n=1 Tax=Sphingobium sp. CECT 9361 TaxID=2845384 RepID=UPI001E3B14AD|nr:hypothetical protein [Sphingobium sp. CECT 9361]CAH0356868.1 hypothetical protein SPH9361_04514 [Sphingobium sp. CECT 9361]